ALAASLAVLPAAGAARAVAHPTDAEIARQGLLRRSDFSSAWKQRPHHDAKPSGIAECKDTERARASGKRYRAQSPDFSRGGTTYAQNSVFVFPKETGAVSFLARFEDASAGTCFRKGTQRALRKVSGATVDIERLDLSSAMQNGLIDDVVGYGIVATVPQRPQPAQLYVVVIAVRIGRSVSAFTIQSPDQVLPETDTLVDAALTRLRKALT